MLDNILGKIYGKYNKKTFKQEDGVVFNFFDKFLNKSNNIKYLEVGSGLCRFPLIVKDRYSNFSIKCFEKNNDLVEFGIKNNLETIQGDITHTDFKNEEFSIIHCSHVIEHLDYNSIVLALDDMFRILKNGGYLIIRSPLLHPGFYFDIDHVRPYPPEAILNYFNNRQQQKVGFSKVSEVFRWYRREAFLINNTSNLFFRLLNIFFRFSWSNIGFPKSKTNGYVLILQKI